MNKKAHWKKRLALALSAGFLVLHTSAVMAAPVELSLNDSIMMALQNNPTIKIADADRKSAELGIDVAKVYKVPSFSLTHSDNRYKAYSSGNSYITNYSSNEIAMNLPLYTGGKAEAELKKAKLGLKSADLGVEKSKQQIQLDATTSYFTILQTINAMKVSEESVDMMVAHLKNVQAQYGVGVVAKSDVLRSEVELASYEQKKIIAYNNYALAVSKFNNVVGLPLETEIKVNEELQHTKYELPLEDSIKYAMVNRPEALQADYAIEVAKQSVTSAQSDNLPHLSVGAKTGWSDDKFPGNDNNTWSVGVSATWNAFDSGVTNAKVKQSNSAVVKATEQAKQTKDAIQLEVRQAYLNMNEADKRIGTTQVAVEKAEEDFKISGVRYSAGVGTNIDVIDAQVALTQAKNNYIQAMYDYNTSKANLVKAMGMPIGNK